MNTPGKQNAPRQRGFSLIEMLVVLLILGIIAGALLAQIDAAQQHSQTEQVKLNDFQQARDFVDQFFRDVNQAGYPNLRMMDPSSPSWSPNLANPLYDDSRVAAGLVKIDANALAFEADSNGDGTPESIQYMLNGSTTCALCLQRSQVDKVTGDPLGQATSWGTEVNDVVTNPIFKYFDTSGNQITALPADTSTAAGRQTLATVKTIQISLLVRNNNVLDPKTGQPIEATFEGEIAINNCSSVATGQTMSCR